MKSIEELIVLNTDIYFEVKKKIFNSRKKNKTNILLDISIIL